MAKYDLILASGSPRRKELLGYLNIPFEIIPPELEEVSSMSQPEDIVQDLARQKGLWVYERVKERFGRSYGVDRFPLVVGSDTLVALGDKVMGKPKDADEARDMLRELSGRVHQVLTGVFIGLLDLKSLKYKQELFYCRTEVEFARITDELLEDYVQSGDPLDKAGSYGIQGQALTFISSVKGSYSNVVGFPLCEFTQKLKQMVGAGEEGPGVQGRWRGLFHGH